MIVYSITPQQYMSYTHANHTHPFAHKNLILLKHQLKVKNIILQIKVFVDESLCLKYNSLCTVPLGPKTSKLKKNFIPPLTYPHLRHDDGQA